MLALFVCSLIAVPFAAFFFAAGAAYERQGREDEVLFLFPPRHPSHQPSSLRLVAPDLSEFTQALREASLPFDQDAS